MLTPGGLAAYEVDRCIENAFKKVMGSINIHSSSDNIKINNFNVIEGASELIGIINQIAGVVGKAAALTPLGVITGFFGPIFMLKDIPKYYKVNKKVKYIKNKYIDNNLIKEEVDKFVNAAYWAKSIKNVEFICDRFVCSMQGYVTDLNDLYAMVKKLS